MDAGTELGPALWWGRVGLLGSVGLGFPECATWGVAFDKFLCGQSPSEIHQEHVGSEAGTRNQQPLRSLTPNQRPEVNSVQHPVSSPP